MSATCVLCRVALPAFETAARVITGGVCAGCARLMTKSGTDVARALAERIAAPTLVMQSDPRVVFTANARALRLLGKERAQAEGRRGGELFDCVNAFTEKGCGKDPGCDDCRIKAAVVEALEGGSARHVSNPLTIRTGDEARLYHMVVSTESVGELALLRIDEFRPGETAS